MRSTVGYATAVRQSRTTPLGRGLTVVGEYALDLCILLAAYLVATYWREVLPFGKYVGTNYQWHTPVLYLTIALGLLIAYLLRGAAQGLLRRNISHLTTLLVSIPLVAATIAVLMPLQSGLQKGYFTILAVPLALLIVPPAPMKTSAERSTRKPSIARSGTCTPSMWT